MEDLAQLIYPNKAKACWLRRETGRFVGRNGEFRTEGGRVRIVDEADAVEAVARQEFASMKEVLKR